MGGFLDVCVLLFRLWFAFLGVCVLILLLRLHWWAFWSESEPKKPGVEEAHDEALEENAGYDVVTRWSEEKILANVRAGYLKVCPLCHHTYVKMCETCLESWTS